MYQIVKIGALRVSYRVSYTSEHVSTAVRIGDLRVRYRVSYRSEHVLLNLLNKLRKSDKIQGNLLLFRN